MRKILTFLFAALMSVGVFALDPIVWNSSNLPSDGEANPFTQGDVTITCVGITWEFPDFYGPGTFTTTLGNFTKIEVFANDWQASGEGWSGSTWTGNAASVSFSGDIMEISSIVFTIGDAAPAPQPAWVLPGDAWDEATKTLTVNSDLPKNAYKSQTVIEHVIINNGVTSIGESAFYECTGLTSIEIPNSVTSIGDYTFFGCTGLTSVTIPNSVNSIGEMAFAMCSGLTSITIPNSVTSIGVAAFGGCTGLTSMEVTSGNTKYDSRDNCKAIIETSSNTLIAGCKNTIIPNSVTSIGDRAFQDCTSLTSVTIPNSVTSIGMGAFLGCTGLTSITIPSSVTSIGDGAFQNCEGLTSITIPNSVTSIGMAAFYGCTGLKSVTIGNSVTSIGYVAFAYCEGLTSVEIPNSVTSIGYAAFEGCSSLTSIEIPNSVTSIGESAFYSCSGLTSVTIPCSVTSIGADAFYDCTNITDVYCYPNAANLTWDEGDCDDFKDDGSTVCHVFASELTAYQAKFTGVVHVTTFEGDLTGSCGGDEPTGSDITANLDPQNAGVYYSTFYHGSVDYALPANVEAYKAVISGSDLLLSEVAAEGDVLPKGNAVILRSSVENYTLTPSDATPVSVGDDNDLEGVDVETAVTSIAGLTTTNCYVLSGTNENGVGFYRINSNNLKAHKAYVKFSGTQNNAPRRMRFVFEQETVATGIDNANTDAKAVKLIENGQLVIIRNGVKYNAQGQIVK